MVRQKCSGIRRSYLNSMIIFMMFGQTYIMVMLDVVSVFLKQFS